MEVEPSEDKLRRRNNLQTMRRDALYMLVIALLVVACGIMFMHLQSNPQTDSRGAHIRSFLGLNKKGDDSPFPNTVTNDLSELNKYALRPGFPIQYDTNLGEYQLVYSYMEGADQVVSRMPLKYCPWTGTQLPGSMRDGMFNVVSSNEVLRIEARLQGVKTLNDAKQVLGIPDDATGPLGDVKMQWTYDHVSETASIIIQELKDGSITIGYLPKRKH